MRFRFIQQQRQRVSISMLCAVLGVSRSGYYAWQKRKPSAREQANQELIEQIQAVAA